MRLMTSQESILSLTELQRFLIPKRDCAILDYRRSSDFDSSHLPYSMNIPLETLRDGSARGSPFADPVGDCTMLEELWLELDGLFSVATNDSRHDRAAETLISFLHSKKVLTICYDGDCARVANSVLRAKGVHSESIRGGYATLVHVRLSYTELMQSSELATA